MNISMLIGGADTAATDNRTYERRDPVTGDVATTALAASVVDAKKLLMLQGKRIKSGPKPAPVNAARFC